MKLLNRQQFLAQPSGVVFADAEPEEHPYEEAIYFDPENKEALRQLINPETDAEKRIGA